MADKQSDGPTLQNHDSVKLNDNSSDEEENDNHNTDIPSPPSPDTQSQTESNLKAEDLKDNKNEMHNRAKTMDAVTSMFEKGEQPPTDKYEIWAWYLYDC